MRRLLPALLAFAATPALAHEGRHQTLTFLEQVRHLVTQPDHILAVSGLVAVVGAWAWRRARAAK